jgi:hypothetical protein
VAWIDGGEVPHADDVLNVVTYFDGLLDDEMDAAGPVRRAASFTGCPVGIRTLDAVISDGPSGARGESCSTGAMQLPWSRGWRGAL